VNQTISSSLAHFFEQLGKMIKVEGNTPLIVTNEQYVWYVLSGHVDIFAVSLDAGEVSEQRRFLFGASTGQILFGYHSESLGYSKDALLISGLSGTTLLKLDMSELRQVTHPSLQGEIINSIDEWIHLWSVALRMSNPATDFMTLEKARGISVAEGTVFRTLNPLWIKLELGQLRWMGDEQLSVQGDGFAFPISSVSWVTLGTDSVMTIYETSEWIRDDPEWDGLSEFHRIVHQSLMNIRKSEGLAGYERLKKRTENDRVIMEYALERLAAVNGDSIKRKAPLIDSYDSLYMACLIIGKELDMNIQQVAGDHLQKSRNPVNDIARASNVRSRQVMLKDEWWKSDNGHLLGFVQEDGRPVALIRKRSSYYLMDPSDGTEQLVTNQLAQTVSPMGHMFYRPMPSRALSVWDIVKFGAHKTLKRDTGMMILMGVLSGLLGMFIPISTGIMFDSIIPESERGLLLQMGMILFSVTLSIFLFGLTRSMAMLRIEGRMDSSIQAAVWDRLLNLPVSFFRDYSAGDLAIRANSISAIRQMISGVAITAIFAGIFSSFNFLLLFYYDVRLALVAALLVLISMLVTVGIGILQLRRQRVLLAIQGKISGTVLQLINGISKFRMAAAEQRAFFIWAKLFGELKETAFKTRTLANIHAVFNAFFPVVTSMVLFFMVSTSTGDFSAGKFIAFFAAFSSFLVAMLSMSTSLITIINIVPQYERAKPILQAIPEVHEFLEDPGELTGSIEIKHVHFRYQADQSLILNNLSMSIRPGEFVALVGASGCGKSTLLRLLLGFEKPESGSLYYDGQELSTLDVRSIRGQLGVVLQNGKVTSGDIFSNIVGSSVLTMDDAWDAARMSGFDEDIRQMPMGMHTVISEGGSTLSGGQRQRMLIARAIARKPKIILFDEATSALDNHTQAIVSESLEKLHATRIVIAHRLSTIINADRIFVMEKGQVVQSGSYEELMKENGLFTDLAKRQMS
jgi:NHLM bacteriocin system ABC transporter ATP-binding protein